MKKILLVLVLFAACKQVTTVRGVIQAKRAVPMNGETFKYLLTVRLKDGNISTDNEVSRAKYDSVVVGDSINVEP